MPQRAWRTAQRPVGRHARRPAVTFPAMAFFWLAWAATVFAWLVVHALVTGDTSLRPIRRTPHSHDGHTPRSRPCHRQVDIATTGAVRNMTASRDRQRDGRLSSQFYAGLRDPRRQFGGARSEPREWRRDASRR